MNSPVKIVGGGLAGLSLGLGLRRAGVEVTIFEAGTYPRHRVCGEFITGLDRATIDRLGLAPLLSDALQHREVAWFAGEAPAGVQRLPAPALGLSRYALDDRLASAFVATGGQLRVGTRVSDSPAQAGRVSAVGRRRGKSDWIGLKVHVRHLALTRDLELHLGDRAYVGLSRVEDDAINVCGLFRRRIAGQRSPREATEEPSRGNRSPTPARTEPTLPVETLFQHLAAAKLEALADRLRAADIDASSFCAVAGLSFGHAPAARGEIRIGDAFAMIPPFTGNGMAMAFQSAAAALGPLTAYARKQITWSEACRATEAALRRRFRLRLASADALHPFLLHAKRQRWLTALNRARLLPLRPLYAVLH